ncbi:MAG: pyridoxal kinase PdxY [Kistimonas sp.]|nr:pyridoxal kinase PdxY [Kistimonas sp.]
MAVLSVQSHVAYGHAGNASAVFPLQRMGYEVWPVHTVMFSNHTGHQRWRGPVFEPDVVADVVQGIEERGVLKQCQALLSGYLGAPAMGEVILEALERVKAANPAAIYCCDPVMGDIDRGVFVRDGIPDFFRDRVVQCADILTPNHFELELLTGIAVNTVESALTAVRILQDQGVQNVLVTSLMRSDAPSGVIEMLVVGPGEAWLVTTPHLDFDWPVTGSGDATAAVFLGKYLQTGSLRQALEHTAGAIFWLFQTTWRQQSRELKLIQAQDAYISPPQAFVAESALP